LPGDGVHVGGGDHFHIHAGGEGKARGFLLIGGVAVIDHLADGLVIADNEAFEFPFVAQDFGEGELVTAGGDAVQIIERAHDGERAGVQPGFELRQIKVSQGKGRDFGGVVIAPAFSGTVTDIMFHAGNHAVGVGDVGALKATDVGGGIE